MRLNRALFYVFLILFVTSIFFAVDIDSSHVMSRVATSLITGSLVGLLSTIINYIHARREFFLKIFRSAMELEYELERELIEAKIKVKNIEELGKDYMINSAVRPTDEEIKAEYSKETPYDKYRIKFDDRDYVPLFFCRKTSRVLEEIFNYANNGLAQIFMLSHLKDSFVCLQEGYFSDKEEEKIVIGDKDSFYEYIVKNMYDWRDYIGYCMRKLWKLMLSLQKSLKPFGVGYRYSDIEILSKSTEKLLTDIPDRNPIEERLEEYEKEYNNSI